MDMQAGSIADLPWTALLGFAGILYLAGIIHVTVMALAAFGFRTRIEEISFGLFTPIVSKRFANTQLSVRAFPFAGYVRMRQLAEQKKPFLHQDDGKQYFDQLPSTAKIIITISGCTALLGISLILMGEQAFSAGFSIWVQFLFGALGPFSTAQTHLGNLLDFIQATTVISMIAVVFAKHAAMNLLPVGVQNGGILLRILLEKSCSQTVVERYLQVSTIVILLIWLSWLVAIFYFFF